MERSHFEWFPYFGFTSNKVPNYGINSTLTYFIFNLALMKEPGTNQVLQFSNQGIFFKLPPQIFLFPLPELVHNICFLTP